MFLSCNRFSFFLKYLAIDHLGSPLGVGEET